MLANNKKIERITARVSEDIRNRLAEAAAFSGATLNQFLVQAGVEKAESIIEKERIVNLSYKDAEVFFSAIESPPRPNSKLKKAAKKFKASGLNE
ncbi:MAG: DUF1778 domain-containing protein [Desulfobacteraceae bacterium]|nr:DUF1778 domain-containing protein [Desulfobacteraceae bacterium]MBU3948969.1 DUF1778 domain-containing protein [Pseudomonadota bacterium]MBU4009165.1 DUF1778 domain-containing protein [Pseudomonadota bacterium]